MAQVGQAHRLEASRNMVGSGNISGTGNLLGAILHQILPLAIPSSSGKQFLMKEANFWKPPGLGHNPSYGEYE